MRIILWLALFIILCIGGIRYIETHSIYFPMKDITTNPALSRLPYADVYFETVDGKKLNGWFIPADRAVFTVLFCHGNAGNIGHRMSKVLTLHDLRLNVFVFDYRGYGRSEGAPSEEGLYKDAQAAYDYLAKERKIPGDTIIFYGESIGGAVAIDLAGKEKVKAIITEETFTSARDMARIAFPLVPPLLFASSFDSVSKIEHIKCEKLIMHSPEDEIVPFSLGMKLFEAAAPPKTFLELRGTHNTAFMDSGKEFRDGLKAFVEDLNRP